MFTVSRGFVKDESGRCCRVSGGREGARRYLGAGSASHQAGGSGLGVVVAGRKVRQRSERHFRKICGRILFTSWIWWQRIKRNENASILRCFVVHCSVSQSCPTLCDRSTPGFPVLHHLLEFAKSHVHWVIDAIQPFYPLSPTSPPALNLLQHQSLFQWVGSSHQVAKGLEL